MTPRTCSSADHRAGAYDHAVSTDFPPDLVALKIAFIKADVDCTEVAASLPPGAEIVAGAEVDWTPLDEARAQRMKILIELNEHKFWQQDGLDVTAAKASLGAVARAQMQA